jgi:hypothetical protein
MFAQIGVAVIRHPNAESPHNAQKRRPDRRNAIDTLTRKCYLDFVHIAVAILRSRF